MTIPTFNIASRAETKSTDYSTISQLSLPWESMSHRAVTTLLARRCLSDPTTTLLAGASTWTAQQFSQRCFVALQQKSIGSWQTVQAGRPRWFSVALTSRSSALSAAAAEVQHESEPVERQYSITIGDIEARRKRDGRLVAGTAAVADINSFKTFPAWRQLPKARRWDHILSKESAAREPCVLKLAASHLKKPGLISLGGGLPSPENFPILSMSLRVPTGQTEFTEAAAASEDGGATISMGKYDASQVLGATSGGSSPAEEYDLSIALNYGQSAGSAQLLRWVTEHTELVCHPPYSDWSTSLTVGSTGALEQALRIFCDRERGDTMLTETYSFSTALETAVPLGIRVLGVEMDEQGMLPESLDDLLSGWDVQARGGSPKPHLLYTVPSGQNPTGATQGAERRKAIYDVCSLHDVYILEDEPYYFLQMPPYERDRPAGAPTPAPAQSSDEFLQSLIPTFVSLDVDGRVMRMDSFSKVLVPGSRMGWLTASEQIIERFVRHGEACNQGPSGFSQAALYELVEKTWGHEGYLKWLAHIRESYTQRRNILLDACVDHLPAGIVSWNPPAAGMFVSLLKRNRRPSLFSPFHRASPNFILALAQGRPHPAPGPRQAWHPRAGGRDL